MFPLAAEDCRVPVVQTGFPRSLVFGDFRIYLDGGAVKLDSEDGVHPGKFFGCVVLLCTLLNVLFAVPANA